MVNPCKSQFFCWLDSTFCRSTPMSLLFKASLKPYNSPRLSPPVPGLLVDMAQTRLPLHDVAGLSVVDACARAGQLTVGWRVMTTLLKDVPPVVAKRNRLLGSGGFTNQKGALQFITNNDGNIRGYWKLYEQQIEDSSKLMRCNGDLTMNHGGLMGC